MNQANMTICIVMISAGVALLIIPLLRYIVVGWRAKRKDIMDGLNADARLAYFQMFSRTESLPSAANASAEFERLYARWYGRRFFVAPSLLLLLVGVTAITLVVFTVLHVRGYISNPFFDVPDTAIAAIAGAYMWTVNDFISRTRRLDFAPSDVLWGVLRLTIAVPMGYAFAAIAAPSVGPFVAFALGAFPLAKVTTMLQQLANKNLNLEATAKGAKDDIIKLQGINKTIVERLANEDINTVTQVAYCDPVQLIMRSNLNFNFVTDCMNQALAWMYLEDDLSKVRPLGMRGAGEIRDLITDYDDASTDMGRKAAHDRAVAAFPKIASALKQDPETLQIVFRQIAEDPYTIFLSRVWT
jgi:hypothetical protein